MTLLKRIKKYIKSLFIVIGVTFVLGSTVSCSRNTEIKTEDFSITFSGGYDGEKESLKYDLIYVKAVNNSIFDEKITGIVISGIQADGSRDSFTFEKLDVDVADGEEKEIVLQILLNGTEYESYDILEVSHTQNTIWGQFKWMFVASIAFFILTCCISFFGETGFFITFIGNSVVALASLIILSFLVPFGILSWVPSIIMLILCVVNIIINFWISFAFN